MTDQPAGCDCDAGGAVMALVKQSFTLWRHALGAELPEASVAGPSPIATNPRPQAGVLR
jgi:hypothetical protein